MKHGRTIATLGFMPLFMALAFAAEPPSRVHGNLDDGSTFVLSGNKHPLARAEADQGEVDGSLALPRITIHFQRTAEQEAQLERLLAEQQNRNSGSYHHWLTPEQYAERFGVSKSDLKKITSWLEAQGFRDVQVNRSRTAVSVSGTALQVETAFRTSIHRYSVNGEQHYANSSDPVLPRGLDGMVESIRGLTDFRPHPRGIARPHFTSSITGNHFVTPNDFATIYNVQPLYSAGIDGSGIKVAIAGQADIDVTNVNTFRSAAGLSVNTPQVVLDGTDPGPTTTGKPTGDQQEAYLDLEWAGGVAPGAKILYVNSKDAFTSALYAIDNNLAPVLSLTYGNCEADLSTASISTLNSEFQKASALGITVVGASGDTGAADCDSGGPGPNSTAPSTASHGLAVDFPASSPYVTGVGGTQFNDAGGTYWSSTNNTQNGSALGYIPEQAWNTTATDGQLSATGGGASTVFAKPVWQVGTGVPNDGARDVPDVALASSPSSDEIVICAGNGDCVNGFRAANEDLDPIGGTSAATPSFAGIVALLNQLYGEAQGSLNANLYRVAGTSTDAFHDIASGNNQVPCVSGSPDCPASGVMGYVAAAGYDQTTGWGSLDANNFVNEWEPNFRLTASPSTITVGSGASGSVTVTLAYLGGFSGAVKLSCSVDSALTNTTCSVPATASAAGNVTLTIANSGTAGVLPFIHLPVRGGPALPVCLLALAGILAVWLLRGRRRLALCGAAAFSFAILTACGGGSSSSTTTQTITPAVTANVTITGASGAISHSATVSVTIP